MKSSTLCLLFSIFAFHFSWAQRSHSDSTITGIWKGTSICRQKDSPCHDETVVYHISKAPGIDSFSIDAYKVVDGKEENMGIIGCKLDRAQNCLRSSFPDGLWTFNFRDKAIEGTLLYKNRLYRIVQLRKSE